MPEDTGGSVIPGEMLQRRARKMQIAPDPDPEGWVARIATAKL